MAAGRDDWCIFHLPVLAIVKKFEPLLLLPIAFGMLLANLPEAGLMQPGPTLLESGVLYIIYQGVKSSVFPCLIFLGVGAMTDFGPLLANPSSLLLGGAAQLGIYVAFVISLQPACLRLHSGRNRHYRRSGRPYGHFPRHPDRL